MAPVPALARVSGALPLSHPAWHNPWARDPAVAGPDPGRWAEVTALYLGGDLQGAARALEEMLAAGFDEAAVRRSLAAVYKDLGEYGRAAAEYQRLLELEPDDPELLVDLGFALLGAGDPEAAAARFGDARAQGAGEPLASFGLGLARYVVGRLEEAAAALEEAVRRDERLAAAHDLLGRIRFEQGDYAAAAAALERAVRLDSSFTPSYYLLAKSYEALGDLRRAWTQYDRSRRVLPGRPEVAADVARFLEHHGSLIAAWEEERAAARRRAQHRRVEPLDVPPGTPAVRVGLLEGAEGVTFSAGAPFRLEPAAGGAADGGASAGGELSAGVWEVRLEEGHVVLEGPEGELLRLQGSVRLTPVDPAATMILYDLEVDRGYFWATREDLQVRGSLELLVRERGITVVNVLDIESYLLAVVPSEMYPSMPLEALKAQAIAARTYVLRALGRYASRGFDVLGSVASTAYRGVAREQASTTRAVLETRGQVLTYQGRLANAVYTSSAGGYTASAAEAWGGGEPFLKAVPEWGPQEGGPEFPLAPAALERWLKGIPDVYSSRPREAVLSTFRWVRLVEADEIARRLGRPVGEIHAIVPGPRGLGGYVRSVTVVGSQGRHEVRGDAIRSALGGLKSNAFKVEPVRGPDGRTRAFLFFGAGFGHGVGMSQFGAAGMAEEGWRAEEILAHYYPGTEIRPGYNR